MLVTLYLKKCKTKRMILLCITINEFKGKCNSFPFLIFVFIKN